MRDMLNIISTMPKHCHNWDTYFTAITELYTQEARKVKLLALF